MLKVRVIPTLLWKNFGLVKGVSFDSWRRVGPVLPTIKVYNSREVDELILVDITASIQGNIPDHDSISDFADECFVPFTVGGCIRSLSQITSLLTAGADKVSLNSTLYENPNLVNDAANQFGTQCIVVSIDFLQTSSSSYICLSHSGTRPTNRNPLAWAREMEDRGAGELLLTSIQRDGTMKGYDLDLIESIASRVKIPVIASGGAGSYQDMVDAVIKAGAAAVAAASVFHFTEMTPLGAKEALHRAGIPIRSRFEL